MISVIISTYKSEKYIDACVDSVLRSNGARFEIIIVDAGSEESQKSKVKSQKYKSKVKSIKTFFLKNNVGLTVSHNKGAGMARGDILLFLDVDTKIDSKALFEIEKFFEKHKDCGAIQGKIETTGHFLSIFGFPWEVSSAASPDSQGIFAVLTRSLRSHDCALKNPLLRWCRPLMIPALIFGARTACMAVRKSVFEKVGGFDEDYFMHGEETDLSWRIWLAGYRIYYLPRAKCIHYGKSHYKQDDRMIGYSEQSKKAYNRLFYEGAKNQITTIVKDAPVSILIWMLPLNILAWMVVGLKSPWVYRGIGRAFLDIKKTIGKRKKVLRAKNNEARKVMFGDIDLFSLIMKGYKWSKSL